MARLRLYYTLNDCSSLALVMPDLSDKQGEKGRGHGCSGAFSTFFDAFATISVLIAYSSHLILVRDCSFTWGKLCVCWYKMSIFK